MKKYYLTIIIAALFYSCATEQKSIGMTTWSDDGKEYKFFLGTQKAVDLVMKYDEFSDSREYQKAFELFADTASITYYDGNKVTPTELFDFFKRRDSVYDANGATLNWNLVNVFSVDIDPTRGGEHVTADYVVNFDDGENQSSFNSILRYYILDGKIVWVNQFNQSVIDD